MFRIILFSFILIFSSLFSTPCLALVPSFPAGVRYFQAKDWNLKSLIFPAWIDHFFGSRGADSILLPGEMEPKANIDWLDRIYISKTGTQKIYVKAHLWVDGKLELGRLYKTDGKAEGKASGNFLIHLADTENRITSFYLEGYNEDSANRLRVDLQSTARSSKWLQETPDHLTSRYAKKSLLSLGLIPTAMAQEDEIPSGKKIESSLCKGLPLTGEEVSLSSKIWNTSKECLKGLFRGTTEKQIGPWYAAGKILWGLYWEPEKTYRKIADELTKNLALVTDLGRTVKTISVAFQTLPVEYIAKIFCDLIAAFGAPSLLALLSGGLANIGAVLKIGAVVQTALNSYAPIRSVAKAVEATARTVNKVNAEIQSVINGEKALKYAANMAAHGIKDFVRIEETAQKVRKGALVVAKDAEHMEGDKTTLLMNCKGLVDTQYDPRLPSGTVSPEQNPQNKAPEKTPGQTTEIAI